VLGDLSSFRWMENNISFKSRREDIVRVVYSSINFRDVMLATGKLTSDFIKGRFQDMSLGLEYVGYDANGQRVMGICDNKYVKLSTYDLCLFYHKIQLHHKIHFVDKKCNCLM